MEEARWNIRLPLEMDIKIQIAPAIRLNARTRDVSFEGMLVATPLPNAACGTTVIVHFDCRGPVSTSAVIVRTGREGTGLMFLEQSDQVADALAVLMESELERFLVSGRNAMARPKPK